MVYRHRKGSVSLKSDGPAFRLANHTKRNFRVLTESSVLFSATVFFQFLIIDMTACPSCPILRKHAKGESSSLRRLYSLTLFLLQSTPSNPIRNQYLPQITKRVINHCTSNKAEYDAPAPLLDLRKAGSRQLLVYKLSPTIAPPTLNPKF